MIPALRGTVFMPEPQPFLPVAARGPRSPDHRVLGEELAEIEDSGRLNTGRAPGKCSRRHFPSAQHNPPSQLAAAGVGR